MEETITCPICETENAPDATNCEVCGERLAPPEPGEELSDEENVAAMIAEETDASVNEATSLAEDSGIELDVDDDVDDDDLLDEEPDTGDMTADVDAVAHGEVLVDNAEAAFQDGQVADQDAHDDSEGLSPGLKGHHSDGPHVAEPSGDDDDDLEVDLDEDSLQEVDSIIEEDIDEAPDFLYSPIDGAAYARGSAEYDEGFGPNGEELVAEPPDGGGEEHLDTATSDVEVDVTSDSIGEVRQEAEVADGPDYEFAAQVAGVRPNSGGEPSQEFRHAFQARQKERPTMQPLPQPGVYAEPATLTVYVNRQPVARHAIETDEVLIGRRDPVADAYPDLDLTDYDPDAHVSRKHAYVYRQNKNYTLYAVSNAGTQLNSDLLDLGDRRPLKDGDVVVLAGKIALKFDVPDA